MKLWNSNRSRWLKASMDRTSNALNTVGYAHHELHDGKMWHVQDSSSNLGGETGDFISIQFTTPAASVGLYHAVFDAYCTGATTIDLREGQTGGGTGGGALTAYNRRRDSANTSGTTFTKDDTVGTGGALIIDQPLGAGVGFFAQGGSIRDNTEWILSPAEIYQWRIYSTAAVVAYIAIDFYLHTDKDTIS